jgi:hypothetical protein
MSILKEKNIEQTLEILKEFHDSVPDENLNPQARKKKERATKALEQLRQLLGRGTPGAATLTCTQQKPLLFSEIEGNYQGN